MQLTSSPGHDEYHRQSGWMTGVPIGVAAAATVVPFVSSFEHHDRARTSGSSVEVDIVGLTSGESKMVEWRGKPVWISRRPPAMLVGLTALGPQLVDLESQREQQPAYAQNVHRSIIAECLVSVDICTDLGSSPDSVSKGSNSSSVGADWSGRFFCPCHGSTFDLAGRVFRNTPAPTNLEVPPHKHLTASQLLIGEYTQPER